jgi:cyanate permease
LIFVIDLKPSNRGLKPYGYEEEDGAGGGNNQLKGVSRDDAVHSSSFVYMVIVSAVIGFLAAYSHMLAAYGSSIGLVATVAAVLSSLSMVGNATFKIGLGVINDKFGGMKMTYCNLGLAFASLVLLNLGASIRPLLYAGAFLAGSFLTISSVAMPLLVHSVYGSRDHTKIFVLTSMCMNFVMSLSQSIVGFSYDITGSFTLSQYGGMIVIVGAVILTYLAYQASRKLVQT